MRMAAMRRRPCVEGPVALRDISHHHAQRFFMPYFRPLA
jgi:hypothetical protein